MGIRVCVQWSLSPERGYIACWCEAQRCIERNVVDKAVHDVVDKTRTNSSVRKVEGSTELFSCAQHVSLITYSFACTSVFTRCAPKYLLNTYPRLSHPISSARRLVEPRLQKRLRLSVFLPDHAAVLRKAESTALLPISAVKCVVSSKP